MENLSVDELKELYEKYKETFKYSSNPVSYRNYIPGDEYWGYDDFVSLLNKSKWFSAMHGVKNKEPLESNKQSLMVYVVWNPLYERVVCVHLNEDESCKACDDENEEMKGSGYYLAGDWFKVN
jgi:hypothetical protein